MYTHPLNQYFKLVIDEVSDNFSSAFSEPDDEWNVFTLDAVNDSTKRFLMMFGHTLQIRVADGLVRIGAYLRMALPNPDPAPVVDEMFQFVINDFENAVLDFIGALRYDRQWPCEFGVFVDLWQPCCELLRAVIAYTHLDSFFENHRYIKALKDSIQATLAASYYMNVM